MDVICKGSTLEKIVDFHKLFVGSLTLAFNLINISFSYWDWHDVPSGAEQCGVHSPAGAVG